MGLMDFHVHLFPDALAERTLKKLAHTAVDEHGDALYYSDATYTGTLRRMDEWGVDAVVTLHIATSAKSMHKVNDFAASVKGPRMYAFGSVHPDAPDALEELERIRELGLDGVKLHPDYQDFFVDESRMAPLYEKMAQLKLPVLFHAGWDPLSPELVHAEPERLKNVVIGYPELTVIAAHLGGMQRYDQVEKHLVGLINLYIDTAMCASYVRDRAQYARIMKAHGYDRVLFATDCPWSTPKREMELLDAVEMTAEEREGVLCGNALRLLKNAGGILQDSSNEVEAVCGETMNIPNTVQVVVDRPLGSRHPNHPDIVYEVNYGYVPGVFAPDGEEQDVYVLGVEEALERFCGRVIAIIHRRDDVETKWVAAPEGCVLTPEEIMHKVQFQERFFASWVQMI